MWYVSWHPLLHKDMPGRHIISRICFPSPPLHLCIVVIKRQERSEMWSDPEMFFTSLAGRRRACIVSVFFLSNFMREGKKRASRGAFEQASVSRVMHRQPLPFIILWCAMNHLFSPKVCQNSLFRVKRLFFSSSSFSHFVFTCSFFPFLWCLKFKGVITDRI